MRCLDFGPAGRRVRKAQFRSRSALPVSAACVVANGVRETLAATFGSAVSLRLLEPAIPTSAGWQAILSEARCYRLRASVADAAIVLRAGDALALTSALFGEPRLADPSRVLSPIECDVLDRLVAAIAVNLGAVCGGRDGRPLERVTTIGGFVTYFEIAIEDPPLARIGIALSREPSSENGATIELGHLAGVRFSLETEVAAGALEAGRIAELELGNTLALEPHALERCSLTAYGRSLARGACGVRGGRYAFAIEALGGNV